MKRFFFWILLIIAVIGAVSAIRLVLNSRRPSATAQMVAEPPRAPFPKSIGARAAANPDNRSIAAAMRKINYLKSRLAGGCE